MIALIGISKNTPLDIRENFSKTLKLQKLALENLKEDFEEAVIISTCNRTEIYVLSKDIESEEEICIKIFKALDYDEKLKAYIFFRKHRKAIKHLMEVACGFHSKILGEDQILGQIRNSYNLSKEVFNSSYELSKLFEMSLNCGKEFKTKTKLYKIPVSYGSIAVSIAKKRGVKNIAILGYGDVGKQVKRYIETMNFEKVFIIVRNPEKIDENFKDKRIVLASFDKKKEVLKQCHCIFACTSAPHYIINIFHIEKYRNYLMFDLSIPRNIDKRIDKMENIKLYDIDELSKTDDENKKNRYEIMVKNKYIVENHIEDFLSWTSLRKITPYIKDIKLKGAKLSKDRVTSFKNKINSNNPEILAETMINSMRDYYINRAIEILKDKDMSKNKEDVLKIIKRIFIED